jgi:hypothetical protein
MEFNVGDRCQWVDRDTDEVTGGTVESILPPKTQKPNDWWRYTEEQQQDFITFATVKWDDGTTDTVDMDDLDTEDSTLEREFRNTANQVLVQIQNKVSQASKLLSEAVKLSEEHGVPFYSEVSFLAQSYFPESFESKFEGVDSDLVYSITDASSEYGYAGWEHSDVC